MSVKRNSRAVLRYRPLLIATLMSLAVTPSTFAAPGDRSPDGLWEEVDRAALGPVTTPLPTAFRAYRLLDFDALRAVLARAPMEGGGGTVPPPSALLTLPRPDGTFPRVAVEQSPVVDPQLRVLKPQPAPAPPLSVQAPDIKTFAFRGVDDPAISGRLTLTPTEVQALMRPPADLARVTPLQTSTGLFYLSFLNQDRTDGANALLHPEPRERGPVPDEEVPALSTLTTMALGAPMVGIQGLQIGGARRHYRLAAATSGEYYVARGNNDVAVVISIITEVNNANLVFEAELGVRLLLNVVILYADAATDPYSTVDNNQVTACTTRNENVAAINNVIALGDYDIGFAFSQGGGNGCAWYVVCLADKAKGAGLFATAIPPGGSTGLLLHEMGHQLGAHHTFSGIAGSCSNPGEFNQTHAYEPGSGSTIASYLGGCVDPVNGNDNVDTSQVSAGQYYHTHTFDEIVDNITSGPGSTCGTLVAVGNQAPIVDAGPDYTIPRGTPFTLTGSAIDPDGDLLTFTWEQFDVAANQRSINTDTGEGPIFRSVPPSLDPSRTFPRLADLLSNTVRRGEILPTTDRTLTFRLTARDNRTGGGGVAYDDMTLTVSGDPFFIISPDGGESYGAGCPIPASWNVGGGSVAQDVSLEFSGNGGNSFTPLVATTPNDGAADVVAPCVNTTKARMKAAAVGNVFFDISNNNFTVAPTPPTVSGPAAVGGGVDDQCQFTVQFTASVVDDCSVSANDVAVQAIKQTANFDLGPVIVNKVQVNPQKVSISGSVLVSNVFASPAKLSIKVTGADACGASTSSAVQVEVVDDTPPTISVSLDPATLWPPNHKLKDITATVDVKDNCPGVGFVLSSITSNEPDNGLGDGDTANDIQGAQTGTPDVSFQLRAERSGGGSGRTYTVNYTATDASDSQTAASAEVVVPHSRK